MIYLSIKLSIVNRALRKVGLCLLSLVWIASTTILPTVAQDTAITTGDTLNVTIEAGIDVPTVETTVDEVVAPVADTPPVEVVADPAVSATTPDTETPDLAIEISSGVVEPPVEVVADPAVSATTPDLAIEISSGVVDPDEVNADNESETENGEITSAETPDLAIEISSGVVEPDVEEAEIPSTSTDQLAIAAPGEIIRKPLETDELAKIESTLTEITQADIVIDTVAQEVQEPNYLFHTSQVGSSQVADWWYGSDPTVYHQRVAEAHALTPARGAGVTVAVIDTGLNLDHPDLAGSAWINPNEIPNNGLDDDGNGYIDDISGWNFLNQDNNLVDDFGHGTHIAGLIAAADNTIGVIGAAPAAEIMPLKVCDITGTCLANDIIAALDYARIQQADIIVLALGSPSYSYILQQKIDEVLATGSMIIASGGNGGHIAIQYPAAYAGVVAVGASNPAGGVASFSNTGIGLDFVSPGVNIQSAIGIASYAQRSGTSQSAGIVAGIFALVRSHFGNVNNIDLLNAARTTAQDLGTVGYDTQSGYGLIDPVALLSLDPQTLGSIVAPLGPGVPPLPENPTANPIYQIGVSRTGQYFNTPDTGTTIGADTTNIACGDSLKYTATPTGVIALGQITAGICANRARVRFTPAIVGDYELAYILGDTPYAVDTAITGAITPSALEVKPKTTTGVAFKYEFCDYDPLGVAGNCTSLGFSSSVSTTAKNQTLLYPLTDGLLNGVIPAGHHLGVKIWLTITAGGEGKRHEIYLHDTTGTYTSYVNVTETTGAIDITISNLVVANITQDSFDTTVDFLGDENANAALTLWYCNATDTPGCDPLTGTSVSMIRGTTTYTAAVANLTPPDDMGDTLNLLVVATDPDGITGSPLVGTATLKAAPAAPLLYDVGGSAQLSFNNANQATLAPHFLVSATYIADFDQFQLELNDRADFTGAAYTQTFTGIYTSAIQYELPATALTPSLPTTSGTTYYVRVRASADSGVSWSAWSGLSWSYTYDTASTTPFWSQTTDAQFAQGVFTNTATTGTGGVKIQGW